MLCLSSKPLLLSPLTRNKSKVVATAHQPSPYLECSDSLLSTLPLFTVSATAVLASLLVIGSSEHDPTAGLLHWLFPPFGVPFCTYVLDLLSSFRCPHKLALSVRPSLKQFPFLLVTVWFFYLDLFIYFLSTQQHDNMSRVMQMKVLKEPGFRFVHTVFLCEGQCSGTSSVSNYCLLSEYTKANAC